MDATVVKELVGFLSHSRPDVRELALENLSGLTVDPDGREFLKKEDVTRPLCRLIGDSKKIAKSALSCLINLCADEEFINAIVERNIFPALVDGVKDKDSLPEIVELNAMLINNLTSTEKGSAKLLGIGEPLAGLHASKLIDTLVFKERKDGKDPYSWIALALMNITQLKDGRDLVLNPDRAVFPLLLPFVKDSNLNRRRGVLGVMKNCCFDTEAIAWALKETEMIPALLYPLRGTEQLSAEDMQDMHHSLHNNAIESTKEREQDVECKKLILESFLLLCKTKQNRELLQNSGVYPILREYEKVEPDDVLNDKIHSLVDLVMLADWQGPRHPTKRVEVIEEKQNESTPSKPQEPAKEEIKTQQPKKEQPKTSLPEIEEI